MKYTYKHIKGWDKTGDRFEVYRLEWEQVLVAIFFDEGEAARFVRERNNDYSSR